MATRRALLDAGLTAFKNTPLALASVQQITDAADVAKGVFYLHFRSRDHFLLALWSEVQQIFLDCAEAAVAGRKSARSRLEALLHIYADMPREFPREVTFWMRMSSYLADEVGEPGALLELRRSYYERLAQLACGSDTPDAIEIASTIDACCWGLMRHNLNMKLDPPAAESLVERVLPAVKELLKRATM